MEPKYIQITEFLTQHEVEESFIFELEQEGIIEIKQKENVIYIDEDVLPQLEMFSRWYYEMGINIAGIDALRNMRNRLKELQLELNRLRNISFLDDMI